MAIIRQILASIYVGIQVESNWTKKWLYLIYIFLFALSSTLAVIIIYGILGGGFQTDTFRFALFGSLFYFFLSGIFFNTAFTVIDDREHYRTLKYIVVSKTSYIIYSLGRAFGYGILQLIGIMLMLVWAIPLFKIQLNVNFSLLLISSVLGFVGSFGIALFFAGYYMLSIRGETSLMDILFGGLFIISGALFPPTLLPRFAYLIAKYFPLSSSIELMRFSLFGRHLSPFLADLSMKQFIGLVALVNVSAFALGIIMLWFAMRRAIRKGYLDITTAF